MSRGPTFSAHAIERARERFAQLRRLTDSAVIARLEDALLSSETVLEEPPGFVVPQGRKLRWHGNARLGCVITRGRIGPCPVEFVVDPQTGSVLTVVDPDEVTVDQQRRRRGRGRRRR